MKTTLSAFSLGLLVGSIVVAGDSSGKTLKALQGQWKITFAQMGDKVVPLDELGIDRLVIKGDKLNIQKGDKTIKTFGLKLIPGQKPAAINWINLDVNKELPCIYELKGDKLQMCFPLLPAKGSKEKVKIERPKSFNTDKRPLGLLKAIRVKSK